MKHFEQLDRDDHNRGRSRHKAMVRRSFRRISRRAIRSLRFDLLPLRIRFRGFTL